MQGFLFYAPKVQFMNAVQFMAEPIHARRAIHFSTSYLLFTVFMV